MLRKQVIAAVSAAAVALSPAAFSATYTQLVLGQGFTGPTGNQSGPQNALQVITLGNDGKAYLPVWQNTSGTWFQTGALPSSGVTFQALATATAPLSVSGAGHLQVLGLGSSDNELYVAAWQDGNGNWTAGGASPIGNASFKYTQIVALAGTCSNAPIQVFGLGQADRLPHLVAFQDSNGTWEASSLVLGSTQFSSISIGYGNGGNVQVFGVGASDGLPYLAGFQNDNGTDKSCSWGTAGSMPAPGSTVSQLFQVNGNHGNLQVIGLAGGAPWLSYWQDSTGDWTASGSIPSVSGITQLAGAQGNSGNLQLFGLGSDGAAHFLAWQNQSGTWAQAGGFPSGPNANLGALAMGNGNGGNVQVIGLDTLNNHIDLVTYQSSSNGAWNAGNDLTPANGGGGGTGGCPRC